VAPFGAWPEVRFGSLEGVVMQPNEFAVESAADMEVSAPVIDTVLAAIQADAVIDAVQYLAEVVTPLGGE
jgi:hypothetical protein